MQVSDLTVVQYRLAGNPHNVNEVTLNRVAQRDFTDRWVIRRGASRLNKQHQWEIEPMPSSRTDAFIERTSWDDVQAALDFWTSCDPEVRGNRESIMYFAS